MTHSNASPLIDQLTANHPWLGILERRFRRTEIANFLVITASRRYRELNELGEALN